MTRLPRRSLVTGSAALLALSACGNGVGSDGAAKLDARVDATLLFLDRNFPGTRDLRDKSVGMLVMPLITEAGFGFGGAYGRGALRIDDISVDYYSASQASFGFQIGAQQYAHVLYFMTEEALIDFRTSDGWAASADAEYVLNTEAENIRAETTTSLAPVIAVIFAQAGLRVGATLEGTKYTRIIP